MSSRLKALELRVVGLPKEDVHQLPLVQDGDLLDRSVKEEALHLCESVVLFEIVELGVKNADDIVVQRDPFEYGPPEIPIRQNPHHPLFCIDNSDEALPVSVHLLDRLSDGTRVKGLVGLSLLLLHSRSLLRIGLPAGTPLFKVKPRTKS